MKIHRRTTVGLKLLMLFIAACSFLISPVFALASEVDSLLNSSHQTSWAYFRDPSLTKWYISNQSGKTYALGYNNIGHASWVALANQGAVANLDFLNKRVSMSSSTAALTPSNSYLAISLVGGEASQYVYGNTANQRANLIAGKNLNLDWYFFRVESTQMWYIVWIAGTDSTILRLQLNASLNNYDWKKPLNGSGVAVDTSKWTKEFFQENGIWKVRFRAPTSTARDDHGNSIGTATVIAANSRTAGNIEVEGDNDFFRINVTSSGTLTVNTTGATDTYGYLLDSNGQELTHNDDSARPNFRISRSVSAGTYYVRVKHFSSGGRGTYTLVSQLVSVAPSARAVLLLHGTNSGPEDAWNDLVGGKTGSRWGGDCMTIYNGVLPAGPSRVDTNGAVCYRIKFGRRDIGGLTGLESLTCSNSGTSQGQGCKGDYTWIFNNGAYDLGTEVKTAVAAIRARLGDNTQVVLLGHSRGGLAARAFLQVPGFDADRSVVVGLITTGTPHKGTPLGRIYRYLKEQCTNTDGNRKDTLLTPSCRDDWQAVDCLRGESCPTLNVAMALNGGKPIDLRTPAIARQSPESADIVALDQTKQNLIGRNIFFRKLAYDGNYLGHLAGGYSAWERPGGQLWEQFSFQSKVSVLCSPLFCSASEYVPDMLGDGVVPYASQAATDLGGTLTKTSGGTVFHTEESERIGDLNASLNSPDTWR